MSVSIHSLVAQKSVTDRLQAALTGAARHILQEYSLEHGEVDIILADNRYLRQLNRQYRGKDTPTDVLSFSMIEPGRLADRSLREEEAPVLGDVYISLDKAEIQARQAGHSPDREVLILAVHGMLHLVGYDHGCPDGYEAMRKKESEIISLVEPPEGGKAG